MKYKLFTVPAMGLLVGWSALPGGAFAAGEQPEPQTEQLQQAPESDVAPETADAAVTATAATTPHIASNITGSYLSGRYARAQGDIDQAVRSHEKVHERQPENMSIAVQLQGMLLLQGKLDAAAQMATKIRAAGLSDPLSDLILAATALRRGEIDKAGEVLDVAEASGNLQLWVPLLNGWLDVQRGRLDKPLSLAAFSVDVGRAAPLIQYHLALINYKAGFNDEAVRNFGAALENPRDAAPRMLQRMLEFYQAQGQPVGLAPLVEQYADVTSETMKDGPLPVIRNGTDGIAEVLYTMGGIMFGAGVIHDAAIYLQLSAFLRPDMAESHLALGDAYSQMKQYARANASYEKVASTDTLYPRAQLHIAVNKDRMGNAKDAIALLDRLARQNPEDADALVTKGDLQRMHGRYKEAVSSYDKAISRMKDLEPSDWSVFFARGSCLEQTGNWPAARRDLEKALSLKPDQPDVLNYLGYAQMERGENVEAAQEMIARAVEVRPNDAQIVDSMGWALYRTGNYNASLAFMEKAVELLPSDPTVNDHLGDVYWQLGRKTEARFQWERALSYSPDPRLADSIQRKLRSGLIVIPPASPPQAAAAEPATEVAGEAPEPAESATP